jgi:hypothetical protein
MERLNKYFALFVALVFFVAGAYILWGPTFSYLTKEIRLIFAVFLFLYGGFRAARAFMRNRDRD